MLDLQDEKWRTLLGGYGLVYDASTALRELENNPVSEEAWDDIRENLHHQGDIGEASYAIIPNLIDIYFRKHISIWQVYSFVSLILIESHRQTNPRIPNWLYDDFQKSMAALFKMSIDNLQKADDSIEIRAIIGFICLHKKLLRHGALITNFDESEINEYMNETMEWEELYSD